MGRRVRLVAGLWLLAEVAVFIAVAVWLGVGWTILLTLATSALGGLLLGRQGTRALADLHERALTRQHPARALGDAGLVAVGGLLMLLPGFLGDVVGLLCLLPATRGLPRLLLARLAFARLPVVARGPVRVHSDRLGEVSSANGGTTYRTGATRVQPMVIEGQVLEGDVLGEPRTG
jgi:UPF0716 protein FxsA